MDTIVNRDHTKAPNRSEGGWIVQKFGGTSVGKFASSIATEIVP